MSDAVDEKELEASTSDYKIPEKKTLKELESLDKDDEALNRWKQSLIKKDGAALPQGSKCQVTELAIVVEGRDDITIDFTSQKVQDAIAKKELKLTFKEGAEYRMRVKFIVADIVVGLKFVQVVKKGPLSVDKTEEMIGSYGPQEAPYTKLLSLEQVPSGMLGIARGKYNARARFVDDDKSCYLDLQYTLEIASKWDDSDK